MKNLFIALFLFSLFGCEESTNSVLVKNTGRTQGSFYHIQYLSKDGKNYIHQIDSILLEIDSSLSIYKSYSLISRLNYYQEVITDTMFNEVYNAAQKIYFETDGNFDCSVYPLLEEWGFYRDVMGDSTVIDSSIFQDILPMIGFDKISLLKDSLFLPDGMKIDFNALAQGYSVDVIGRFLEKKGGANYLIEIGGEILAKGRNADGDIWRIGIEKPVDTIDFYQRFQIILELENKALATSGNYRKFFEKDGVKYSHTINPFTGFPSYNRLLSVSVIYDNCMLADAYATAFMVMGVQKTKSFLAKNTDIDAYLIYTDNNGQWKTYISPELIKRIIN